MKKGLILEGGAMRGLFTAGIIDVLMEENIDFDINDPDIYLYFPVPIGALFFSVAEKF